MRFGILSLDPDPSPPASLSASSCSSLSLSSSSSSEEASTSSSSRLVNVLEMFVIGIWPRSCSGRETMSSRGRMAMIWTSRTVGPGKRRLYDRCSTRKES